MSRAAPDHGRLDGRGRRVAVVVARFNEAITVRLRDGARAALRAHGVVDDDVEEVWAPGAFELPLVAKRLAASGRWDAVVCLGAVVRGDTPHFEYVAGEAARGVQQVALDTGVPCVFGVLTTDDVQQAEERARDDESNKGYEAALAALDVVRVLDRVDRTGSGCAEQVDAGREGTHQRVVGRRAGGRGARDQGA